MHGEGFEFHLHWCGELEIHCCIAWLMESMAEAKHCSNDNWELLIQTIGDDGFRHIMEFLPLKDIDKC
jgi:hypothetical protein